ncbi:MULTISPECIES: Asp-tRNA(Asn)/Glu-tRNA(Gln) amidotransferase subunit GatA [Halomicrobium]|uniref:Glutamyl-tRNA(Gln) amidotransferase subunit A n=2 Tax=Halomicrobium mukohataei TaxID=57705 RepID=C7NVX7_HALMD|nr:MULTISPECIES: Asp-tRNA(Asn)/Glu-tRNA(Gln) amidotransferase subunit GatA [Halomicrobium]ACV48106.1 glutamyl-tRNA(Gln) amidotransferase, A subunit [Halomicrobium mukohataei DSM 12286]QCD66535.1 Asp-tRNA(Asn)/Glu-tRNA(Gln) amidotransferase subunit GatA [Halomicrobium mukohataei]QFR21341.1 Asp-tRNA(Asn)/Glu-tRNA(Gln) amidotransferase subunit GatA [Halomicrobium sp. ZPS1]
MATEYNAYISDETIEGADEGPLAGQTVAVKDNISTKGVQTTCGSSMLAGYVPPYDATVVERLTAAGATVPGKTNMDEFGMGTTTETSAYGPVENPAAPGHVPGGSSGGSAAVVAAGDADMALGTDTGGSIRCPAAFCGVVGIKPTYGLVSRYGLVAYANSLEQIGPIAPTVEEAAELLEVIAGPDEHDATTRDHEGATEGLADAADGDVDGLSIGVPTELVDGADEAVVETFWDAIDELEAQGASYHEVDLPSVEHAVEAYYVIAMSEASSNLARFDGVRYGQSGGYEGNWNESFANAREDGFGEEVKRRVLLGTYALSAGYHDKYYKKAQDARAWVKQDFDSALDEADVLASPTMPIPPMEMGESLDDPLTMYLADANTTPVNLANLPAISVPAGETDDGLPVGLQLVGPAFGEKQLIRAGSALA